MYKDPLIRRFLSGSLFAAAFVWMAVTQFNVDMDTIWVLLKMSFVFVAALIVIGLVTMPIVRLFYRRRSFLDDIDEVEPAELEAEPEEEVSTTNRSPGSE